MFLLTLRPAQLELWAHSNDPGSGDEPVSKWVYVFVLTLAMCGGALHGIAMALRKKYGEGIEKYWLEPGWWVGTIADGFAGWMIWPAMPFVSVQILVPLIIVLQLGSSYILGLFLFHEPCLLNRNLGLACAFAGVIGVSLSTSHQASHFSIGEFWAGWVTTRFLATSVIILIILTGCFKFIHRSSFWALVAAACEGIQYICSRSIVDSIFERGVDFIFKLAVLAAIAIKICCILGILHSQQLGFNNKADLSQFAGIYLIGCTVFTCVYGWAFFGDAMPYGINLGSFSFVISFCLTSAGIWLLNQSAVVQDVEDDLGDAKTKFDVEGKPVNDVLVANPQDS